MPTRSELRADQRRRILGAIAGLVASESYEAITVIRIVRAAGVSSPVFHEHFQSKEAAVLALSESLTERMRDRTAAVLRATEAEDWPVRVSAVLRAALEAILADPLLAKATIVEAPAVGPVIVDRYWEAMLGLVPLLREGRASLRDPEFLPPTIEQTLAGGVFWSAYGRLLSGEAPGIEELLPDALEFILRPYLGEAAAVRWARRAGEDAEGGMHRL